MTVQKLPASPQVRADPKLAENGAARRAQPAPGRPESEPPPAKPRPRASRPSPELALRVQLSRACDTAAGLGALVAVFIATNLGRMPGGIREFLALRITVKNLVFLTGFVIVSRLLCRLVGMYSWSHIKRRRMEMVRVALAFGLISAAALVFPAISATGAFRYSAVLYFWVTGTAVTMLLRTVVRSLVAIPESGTKREVIIVGTGPRAVRLLAELQDTRPGEYHMVGFLDSDDHRPSGGQQGAVLGTLDDIESVLMHHAIDEVFIALPIKSYYADIQRVIESCERVGVRARYMADLFGSSRGWVGHVEDAQVSLVAAPPVPKGWQFAAKRTVDLLGASIALILLAPLLIASAIAIKLTSPGPVLFAQDRYGMNRRLFKMYKLRTMVADAEQLQAGLEEQNEASGPVFKIRRDPRVTPVGRLLRRMSIDELPQLFNVLGGEMSLVGPRPLPVRDVHRFTEAALMRRFSVRPGLTCLWQISGRNEVGFEEWIRLDLKYIDEWSLPLDVKILIRTVPVVLKGTGAA
jgi:exopolysaccharide biosynthesis polyprenyl glycosylphosphotransferase